MKSLFYITLLAFTLVSCFSNYQKNELFETDCEGYYGVRLWDNGNGTRDIRALRKYCENEDVMLELCIGSNDSISYFHRVEKGKLTHEYMIKNNRPFLGHIYVYDEHGNEIEEHSFLTEKKIMVHKFTTNEYDINDHLLKQTQRDILGNIKYEINWEWQGDSIGTSRYNNQETVTTYTYNQDGLEIAKSVGYDKGSQMVELYKYENNKKVSIYNCHVSVDGDTSSFHLQEELKYDQHGRLIESVSHGSYKCFYDYFQPDDLPEDVKVIFTL